MPNDMEHERHRWSYMSEAKLATRLGRIRDAQKLANFVTLAIENHNVRLLRLAAHRAHQLGYAHVEARAERGITEVMRLPGEVSEQRVWTGRTFFGSPPGVLREVPRRDQVVRRIQSSADMSKVNSCVDCGIRVPEMNQRTYEYNEENGLHHFYCPECELKRRIVERRSNTKPVIRKIRFRRKNDKTK